MKLIKLIFFIFFFLNTNVLLANDLDFKNWLKSFKLRALDEGISQNTIDDALKNVKFLEKVIEYDRYQPEFYEDTKTYIEKRTSKNKITNGKKLYYLNSKKITTISKAFNIEKELLLSLMGIETNFGTYLGKMDILSSLATLSFDERRSEFFSRELIMILKLIDKKIINQKTLFGSWAGAYGYFQFMPSTISNYALDYDNDQSIDLKSIDDSFASAANYMNKMGWNYNQPCFYKINLNENIPEKYLNYSAKNIKHKKKFKYFKKYIINSSDIDVKDNMISAIITPDKEIVKSSEIYKPAYLIFPNYELILKWNRSLRFALAVCTLKNKFKNEL